MWTSTTLAVLCGCTLLLTGPGFANGQLVTSFSGTYQGSILTGDNGQQYNAFRGIPYAEPPTGDLRFKKTVPKAPFFESVYDATKFGPFCIQGSAWVPIVGPGQEDCLYLNVYTPTSKPTSGKLRKVFVYIHGGSNTGGNSNTIFPGTLVTTFDLVVVTLNYRLGVFGFLSTLTPDCLGNFGLWDQIRALEWVRDNIQAFGGDSQAVTLGGESAGAFDASVLALSSSVQGLFQRVIVLSKATGLSATGWNDNPLVAAVKAARSVGCIKKEEKNPVTEADWRPVVTCLRQLPAQRLANTDTWNVWPSSVFSAVKDGDLLPYGPYEVFQIKQYLEAKQVLERDYLVSVLQNEGSLAQDTANGKKEQSGDTSITTSSMCMKMKATTEALIGKAKEHQTANLFTDSVITREKAKKHIDTRRLARGDTKQQTYEDCMIF
ncbi:acetylcholinesterase-1-like [Aplysia californica]|uniref:Carboxylic ester hydrolase n=1 Tax=Aplysia californica TaxID=6500 RepID=A0ABM1VP24_APLCA|nr:acetylcholinesterase-1-like [Aplysia californica]